MSDLFAMKSVRIADKNLFILLHSCSGQRPFVRGWRAEGRVGNAGGSGQDPADENVGGAGKRVLPRAIVVAFFALVAESATRNVSRRCNYLLCPEFER